MKKAKMMEQKMMGAIAVALGAITTKMTGDATFAMMVGSAGLYMLTAKKVVIV
jgi:hypothetical protein